MEASWGGREWTAATLILWSVLGVGRVIAQEDAPRAVTPTDKKEIERILKDFVDADEPARAKLVEAAAAYHGFAPKDFQPFADKLIKLRRRYAPPKGGSGRETLTLADGVTSWTYQVRVPGSYKPGKPVPMLIFLHGTKGYDRAEDWSNAGPGAGYLTVTPLAPSGWWDRGETDALLFETMRQVRRTYSVDADRIFLAGYNLGGSGTWYYGLRFPHLFAGIAPMAAHLAPGNDILEAAMHVPAYLWHGEKDEEISPESSRKAAETLKQLGYKVQYKEIPGGLTTDWYFKSLNDVQKELFGHFAKLKRVALPDQLVWARRPPQKIVVPAPVPWPETVYWIEVRDADKTARVQAERPSKGKFKLTTEGVRRVVLLLNSELADLNQPVEVELDGKLVPVGPVRCNLATLLKTWGRYEDPDLTFWAEISVGR